jgi:hypothetical protein
MKRQGWFQVPRHVVETGTLIKEVLASCDEYSAQRLVEQDAVKVYARHSAMEQVADDEWPEYMLVVTVMPDEPTKWEFKRI